MYFVTGGAFQGKRRWVQELIDAKLSSQPHIWINGYEHPVPTLDEIDPNIKTIIMEGMERHIQMALHEGKSREYWQQKLKPFIEWENESQGRTLILIGTEVGLGIVPMQAEDRMYRDVVGWVYQDLAKESKLVVRLWCGLPQFLKEEQT
ncbi:bifunctional adenosylcobinamide kinase/adenosylcobinamide-phosphate guanylyltransferase [Bacillus sp. AK128]